MALCAPVLRQVPGAAHWPPPEPRRVGLRVKNSEFQQKTCFLTVLPCVLDLDGHELSVK